MTSTTYGLCPALFDFDDCDQTASLSRMRIAVRDEFPEAVFILEAPGATATRAGDDQLIGRIDAWIEAHIADFYIETLYSLTAVSARLELAQSVVLGAIRSGELYSQVVKGETGHTVTWVVRMSDALALWPDGETAAHLGEVSAATAAAV